MKAFLILLVLLACCAKDSVEPRSASYGTVDKKDTTFKDSVWVYDTSCACEKHVSIPGSKLVISEPGGSDFHYHKTVRVPYHIYSQVNVGDFIDLRRSPPLIVPLGEGESKEPEDVVTYFKTAPKSPDKDKLCIRQSGTPDSVCWETSP